MTGIVYCLENLAMPDLVKIGQTTDLEQRLRQLDGTNVPLPFVCVMAVEVDDATETEKLLHAVFSDHRVHPRREFFKVDAERVADALRLTRGRDVTPKSDVVEDEAAQVALDKARRRENFNFDMVDIKPGAELRFRHAGISNDGEPYVAEVVSRKKIKFDGEETTLSAAATSILQKHQGGTWSAQGPRYWYYEDESLAERRRRMEEGDD